MMLLKVLVFIAGSSTALARGILLPIPQRLLDSAENLGVNIDELQQGHDFLSQKFGWMPEAELREVVRSNQLRFSFTTTGANDEDQRDYKQVEIAEGAYLLRLRQGKPQWLKENPGNIFPASISTGKGETLVYISSDARAKAGWVFWLYVYIQNLEGFDVKIFNRDFGAEHEPPQEFLSHRSHAEWRQTVQNIFQIIPFRMEQAILKPSIQIGLVGLMMFLQGGDISSAVGKGVAVGAFATAYGLYFEGLNHPPEVSSRQTKYWWGVGVGSAFLLFYSLMDAALVTHDFGFHTTEWIASTFVVLYSNYASQARDLIIKGHKQAGHLDYRTPIEWKIGEKTVIRTSQYDLVNNLWYNLVSLGPRLIVYDGILGRGTADLLELEGSFRNIVEVGAPIGFFVSFPVLLRYFNLKYFELVSWYLKHTAKKENNPAKITASEQFDLVHQEVKNDWVKFKSDVGKIINKLTTTHPERSITHPFGSCNQYFQ